MTVVLIYIVLSLVLSGQWIAAKLGVTAVPALELSTMRYAIASVVLLVACAVTRTPLPMRRWPIVVLGPASDVALIIPTTIPAAAALFASAIGDKLTSRRLVGLGVATLGTVVVIAGGQQSDVGPSGSRIVGDVLELLAAAAWAAGLTVGAVAFRRGAGVFGYVTLMVTIGAVLIAPLGFLQEGYRDLPRWNAQTWLAAAFLGVISTALAFVLFFWAVRRFGASLAAMVSYLTPVTTLGLAFAILNERPLPLQLAGGAVIVVGVRIAARRRSAAVAPPVATTQRT
ncbi:MAG: DMT family transporter [Chloroflexi bacterium]|nr:MAG: DMT family transporter [Chloroflexota bacterium]